MQVLKRRPHRRAVWLVLAIGGLLLQGCAEHPAAPAGPQPRLFASDFQGAAKSCTATKPKPAAGKDATATMKVANDGGWCAISVADDGKPYAAGLLTESPVHGSVYIHPVGNDTRIDYTPDLGFAGEDHFVATLLPGDAVVRVKVTVTP